MAGMEISVAGQGGSSRVTGLIQCHHNQQPQPAASPRPKPQQPQAAGAPFPPPCRPSWQRPGPVAPLAGQSRRPVQSRPAGTARCTLCCNEGMGAMKKAEWNSTDSLMAAAIRHDSKWQLNAIILPHTQVPHRTAPVLDPQSVPAPTPAPQSHVWSQNLQGPPSPNGALKLLEAAGHHRSRRRQRRILGLRRLGVAAALGARVPKLHLGLEELGAGAAAGQGGGTGDSRAGTAGSQR